MTHVAKEAAKFLKSTLRLPSSTFPPRPRPAELARYLPRCTDDLYAWQRGQRPAAEPFTLHDGPPYANGELHVGHALNKILKDMIGRAMLAEGRRVDFVPGWDCHGLPIELKALEKHGWRRGHGDGVDPVALRQAARRFAEKTVEKQMAGFRSWAVMADWARHWKTMDPAFELRQLSVVQAMAQHGLIYRKHKPVYWSPSSSTALAEAELEYRDDHVSTAAFVKFPLHAPFAAVADPVHAVIWTTTPWTLPANQAIAINTALQYALVKSARHGLLVVAHARISYLQDVLGERLDVVMAAVPVHELLDSHYAALGGGDGQGTARPIVHADFVSAESGTGLVHCAPGHGMEDYEVLQPLIGASAVSVIAPVDGHGCFDDTAWPDDPPRLQGLHVFTDGNQAVLQILRDRDWLIYQHDYKHKYPIDWRTKEPVIIRATAQWFADISKIRDGALAALDAVTFLPGTGKSRLRSFVETRSEWCISRQRAWGVPIPAIYHKSTGTAVLTPASIAHIIQVVQERGIDAWWSDAGDDPRWIAPGLAGAPSDYVRGTDTMDVWFDSGTSWTSMLSDPAAPAPRWPGPLADLYVEGTDQHRGWFQSSLLTHIAHQEAQEGMANARDQAPRQFHAPFRTLATHGFTLDAQGKKMSKSLGNVIAPSQIISGFATTHDTGAKANHKRDIHPLGPDALRLWVASSEWATDVVISDKVVAAVHGALEKYRLTVKLLLGMLADFEPRPPALVPYAQLAQLDRIALLHLSHVLLTVRKAYQDLEFHRAAAALYRWVALDLSSFYFEAVKDIIYCDSPASERRRSATTTLHHILCGLQQMLGPITPLLVEESWDHSPERYRSALEHPLRRTWTAPPDEWRDSSLETVLPSLMAVNSGVKAVQEAARNGKLMGQSLASDVVIYTAAPAGLSAVSAQTWRELLVVSAVDVVDVVDVDTLEGLAKRHLASFDRAWTRSRMIVGPHGQQIGLAVVQSPRGVKCARCWKYVVQENAAERGDASKDELHRSLCGRCSDAVSEYQT